MAKLSGSTARRSAPRSPGFAVTTVNGVLKIIPCDRDTDERWFAKIVPATPYLQWRRHKLVAQYEQRCADRCNGRHSMSAPEGKALAEWIADYRRTVMDISHLLKG